VLVDLVRWANAEHSSTTLRLLRQKFSLHGGRHAPAFASTQSGRRHGCSMHRPLRFQRQPVANKRSRSESRQSARRFLQPVQSARQVVKFFVKKGP
jgi:hypothetical protein